jgi:hypothetical protein
VCVCGSMESGGEKERRKFRVCVLQGASERQEEES